MIVLHPTTLGRLDCSLHYWFSRDYKPITSADYQEFGLAIHYALEKYYGSDMKLDPVKAFKDYMKENTIILANDKNYDLGIAMMENYLNHYDTDDKYRYQILATEAEIARRVLVPSDEPNPPNRAKKFYVAARVDGIVYDRELGTNFVLEHKTFAKFYSAQLSRDHQFVIETFVSDAYCRNVLKAGPISGVIYNGLRKAKEPGKTTKLFERHTLYIEDASVDVMLHRAYWELKRISAKNFPIYPEPNTMKCNYCGFKQPCTEYMTGGDYQFVLDNMYAKREESDDEWDSM